MGLFRNTLKFFCKRYSEICTKSSKQRGVDHYSEFTNEQKEQICGWVYENKLLTQKDFQRKNLEKLEI